MADAVLAVAGFIIVVIITAAACIAVPARRRELETRRGLARRQAMQALPGRLTELDQLIERINNARSVRELDALTRQLREGS